MKKLKTPQQLTFLEKKNKSHEIVDALFKADKNYLKARIQCSSYIHDNKEKGKMILFVGRKGKIKKKW